MRSAQRHSFRPWQIKLRFSRPRFPALPAPLVEARMKLGACPKAGNPQTKASRKPGILLRRTRQQWCRTPDIPWESPFQLSNSLRKKGRQQLDFPLFMRSCQLKISAPASSATVHAIHSTSLETGRYAAIPRPLTAFPETPETVPVR